MSLPEVVDPTDLTDADWAAINTLKRAYAEGGGRALKQAIDELAKDDIRYLKVMGALYPDMIREMIRDRMAEAGLTEEDIREIIRKLESPARDQ
jgi:hypothetical protein